MRKLCVMLLILGAIAGAPWALTQAIFSDSSSIGANTFTTGSVDIATSPVSALVSFSGMAPGDRVTAPVAVSNNGSLQLRYAISTAVSGDQPLADGLTLEIRSGVTSCTDAGFDASGSSLYSGALSAGAVGDPLPGGQSGDRIVAPGSGEDLCFRVSLPSTAGSSLQGLSTVATFVFDAEQTSNNP